MKKYTFSLLFTLLAGLALAQSKPRRIWFDTDLMIGLPERAPREVDDAITLMMALQLPDKVDIAGISTVTYVDYGYDVAQKLLKWYNRSGRTIPVYRGSDSGRDTGVENDATRALAEALRREKLAILAIGPVTNVATVVKNHPELAKQIEEVVVCAGRTPGYSFKPGLQKVTVSDYNFERDPEAFRVLFNAGVKIVLSGFECSVYTFLGKTDVEFLASGSEGDQWVHGYLKPWMKRGAELFGPEGFIPYDVTPLGYLTHPEYFLYHQNIPVEIIPRKNDATIGANRPAEKPFLEASYDKTKAPWRATYAYRTLPGFEEILLETLKQGRPKGN